MKKGATTVWERWNSILPDGTFDTSGMNSLNHYAYGAIGDWLYRKVAGIELLECGYKKIRIKPALTKGMSKVQASYHSMYGEIVSSISCEEGRITVDVVIPANTTAVLELPDYSEKIEVGSGSWHYEYAADRDLRVGRYSLNSTFAQILESKEAAAVLEKCMPEIAGSPMMGFIRGKTLNEMIAMAPRQREQIEELLAMLNR